MYNKYFNINYKKDFNNLKKHENSKENQNLFELSNTHLESTIINKNIDSRKRQIEDKIIIEKDYNLIPDPLKFNFEDNIIEIYLKNHNFKINDKIIIKNISNNIINLSTNNLIENKYEDIIFYENYQYIKFNYNFNKNKNIKLNDLKIDEFEPQYIYITNVDYEDKYIGNIPINLLFGKHKMYFNIEIKNNEFIDNTYDTSYFHIKLPITFNKFKNTDTNIIISFYLMNIGGINISNINVKNLNDINSIHDINAIKNDDIFIIKLNSKLSHSVNNCTCNINCNGENCQNIIGGAGGSNIVISKIKKIINGFKESNNYLIDIGTINNIKNIYIDSSDFPHSEYNIVKYPKYLSNNKLYFNTLNNCNDLFKIELDEGFYYISNLVNILIEKISSLQENIIGLNEKDSKLLNFIPEININSHNDVIKFKLYHEIILKNVINNIDNNLVKIYHINHNLDIGYKIIISNSLGTNGIPSSVINKEHTIFKIIDNNNYLIKLDFYNIDNNIKNTNGGESIIIKYPVVFRLDFSKNNTIGKLLGFRKSGDINSITHYQLEVTNQTPYINEDLYDNNNHLIKKINDRINLFDKNYFLISCNFFNNIESTSNYFTYNNSKYITIAKVYLNNPGSVVYNNHINIYNLDKIIPSINKIEFIFHDNNNNLYNFGNLDHSFNLNFIVEKIIDKNSFINSNTGLSMVDSKIEKVFIDEINNNENIDIDNINTI